MYNFEKAPTWALPCPTRKPAQAGNIIYSGIAFPWESGGQTING
jgi:hypothetical protein